MVLGGLFFFVGGETEKLSRAKEKRGERKLAQKNKIEAEVSRAGFEPPGHRPKTKERKRGEKFPARGEDYHSDRCGRIPTGCSRICM
jgi:hypothetical protein